MAGTATPTPQQEDSVTFNPAQIREFTPQNYDLSTVCLPLELVLRQTNTFAEYAEWEYS